jgi:AmiR/NasT family two-component response regulator
VEEGVMTISEGQERTTEDPELYAALEPIRHLKIALKSRTQIGVAVGVVMARYRMDERQAFGYLTRRSMEANVKVRDVAVAVLTELESRDPADCHHDCSPARLP